MITHTRAALTAFALSMVLAGCSSGRSELPEVSPRDQAVTVEVTNHNWQDVTVYVIGSRGRFRLGTVTTTGTQRFRLPSHMVVDNIRFEADPIGGGESYYSDEILLSGGNTVTFAIQNHMALSSLMVRN